MIRRLLPFADLCGMPLRWVAIAVAICAAIGSAARSPAAPATVATMPAPETVQMGSISVRIIGKGSPVVMIPGLSSPRAIWDGVADDLARRHTLYLVQVNGFGGDDPRENLKPGILDGALSELHALIADRKLKGVPVIGHSMGGLLALMLAKAHPGDAGKLLIVDALPFVGSAFFPGSTVATVTPQAEAMRAQMAGLYGKPLPQAVATSIASTNALKPASREKVAEWMALADMRVSGQALYEDMMTDLRPDLAKIAAPITVVVPWTAQRGEAAVLDFYRSEYAGAPNVTLKGVADSGHFVMLDQPEAFRAALDAFLAD